LFWADRTPFVCRKAVAITMFIAQRRESEVEMPFRAERWLLGLPVLALVWGGATWLAAPRVEGHIRGAVQEAPGMAGLRRVGARVDVRGLDVVILADFDVPEAVRQEAERAAAAIGGVRRVRIEIAQAITMEPFRLSVRRARSGLQMDGGVPPGPLHAKFVENALAIVPADRLEDKLVPALGGPPAFDQAAELALRLAGQLARGEVTLVGQTMVVRGDTDNFDAYNTLMTGLNRLPLGYRLGTMDVTPPEIRAFVWKASRSGPNLELSGYVPSEQAREAVRAAAAAEMPGLDLADKMQTARGLDRGTDFAALTRVALSALARLDRGEAEFEAGRLALNGAGVARDLLDGLADQVRKNLPSGVKPGAVVLTAIPASPYAFAARRAGGRVRLSGFAPGPTERGAVQASVTRRFPGEAIVDELHIADGSPEGFAAAASLSLDALSELADGEARITDRRLELSGRALYAEAAERIRQRIAKAVPAGWTGAAEIRAEPFEKPLETGLCGDLLADVARRDPIRFEPGTAEPAAKSRPGLEALSDVVRRCGPARIRVVAHIETPGNPEGARELARRRAAAVAAALGGGAANVTAEGTSSRTSEKGEADRLAFMVEP
jgi:outer membrane protein OmpA-like peptidoglycan-associated protein